MWNLLEDVSLIDRLAGDDGEYDAHVHLAQIVSLLGDPPKELVQRERFFRRHQLERAVRSPRGNECENMNEFWGGPFFDDDGKHGELTRRRSPSAYSPQTRLSERTS